MTNLPALRRIFVLLALPAALCAPARAAGPVPPVPAPVPASGEAPADPAAASLVAGVLEMVHNPDLVPDYLGGYHPDWNDNNDHCFSIYFRIAIRQGLLTPAQGSAIMARIEPLNGDSFRSVMFPGGFRRLEYRVSGGTVVFPEGAIPAGRMISMDGSDHVMLSTGRLLPGGRHEVFSFKGGGPETPVWGDSVGYDPNAVIHVLALEDEFDNLANDDQPIDDIFVAEGRPAILPPVPPAAR